MTGRNATRCKCQFLPKPNDQEEKSGVPAHLVVGDARSAPKNATLVFAVGLLALPTKLGDHNVILSTESIPQLLAEWRQEKFYGLLSLQFFDGEVTLIERKETILTDKANTRGGTRVPRDTEC